MSELVKAQIVGERESGGSQQLPETSWHEAYASGEVAEPPYDLASLASLYEINAAHKACVDAKTTNIVGLGYRFVPAEAGREGRRELLRGETEAEWAAELVRLGETTGVTVARQVTVKGEVSFALPTGTVSATVYKAREPDVTLDGAAVYLVQRVSEQALGYEPGGAADSSEGAGGDEYAVMVDDPYWGRRLQGTSFAPAPGHETIVMGYRLGGKVLQDGEPVAAANVSLAGIWAHAGGREVEFWDSLEYNGLRWSESWQTFVASAEVYAPIMTDSLGEWEILVPKGHGAPYQRATDRRDDSLESAAEPSGRWLAEVRMAYRGRQAVVAEGAPATINLLSGQLVIRGEPGARVKTGVVDEAGESYQLPASGEITLKGLVEGEYAVVQYQLNSLGEWDSSYGCQRQLTEVRAGEVSEVEMGALVRYDTSGDLLCGRVYERPGVPAAGLAIRILDGDSCQFGAPVACTDASGYWEVKVPATGLGGDPWVHDEQWGTVPCLGFPYSEVVLGARAYAAWEERYKPEAWRQGDQGHANFQFVPDTLRVQDKETQQWYESTEVAHGGWVTVETLPKFRYMDDPGELMQTGPQVRLYSLYNDETVVEEGFVLRSQSFSSYEELAGQYRAAGYYPETKILLGGKAKGSVVVGDDKAIIDLPEAQRLGLEFGEHEWYVEVQHESAAGMFKGCLSDVVCPYCGGPAWRDPGNSEVGRGHCVQCAQVFEQPLALDCRTHFVSPTLPSSGSPYRITTVQVPPTGPVSRVRFMAHWRPDLYDETDEYLRQNGPGQATSAPRWFARHVHEVGDGKGFGQYVSDHDVPFVPGHDLEYYRALTGSERSPGLTQMKVALPVNSTLEESVTVEVECILGDDSRETVSVILPAGMRGPHEDNPWGEVQRLRRVNKQKAEQRPAPHKGAGFYKGVADIRLSAPASSTGFRFTVINDVPLLASVDGVMVKERQPAHLALQIAPLSSSGPHLLDDGVGQVFLVYERDGDLWLARRSGLGRPWEPARAVTHDGGYSHPGAEKDLRARLHLTAERGGQTVHMVSENDGGEWVMS